MFKLLKALCIYYRQSSSLMSNECRGVLTTWNHSYAFGQQASIALLSAACYANMAAELAMLNNFGY